MKWIMKYDYQFFRCHNNWQKRLHIDQITLSSGLIGTLITATLFTIWWYYLYRSKIWFAFYVHVWSYIIWIKKPFSFIKLSANCRTNSPDLDEMNIYIWYICISIATCLFLGNRGRSPGTPFTNWVKCYPKWICSYTHYNVGDEFTYPLPQFGNG